MKEKCKEITKVILKKLGLFEYAKKIKNKIQYGAIDSKNVENNEINNKNKAKKYIEREEKQSDKLIKHIEKYCEGNNKDKILFSGISCIELRLPVLYKLAKEFPELQFITFEKYKKCTLDKIDINKYDFAYHQFGDAIERLDIPSIYNYFFVPSRLGDVKLKSSYIDSKLNINIFPEFKTLNEVIESKKYLEKAIENYMGRHPDLDKNVAKLIVYKSYEFLNQVLDIMDIKVSIIWNKFYVFNNILDEMCKERGIKTLYFEYGVLPGTFVLEDLGQMGESYPAIYKTEFMNKEVNEYDIEKAEKVLDFLQESKLNRNAHIDVDFDFIESKIIKGRPIVFYAGQNDFESGLQPYDEYAKKYHSPYFNSSDAAAIYLSELAKKNNWNLIYKPHPIFKQLDTQKNLKGNIIQIDSGDINELIDFADVTITILSQTAYVSLIREKATVLLGYNQLVGKRCLYETDDKDNIENIINDALVNGYTKDQKDAFLKHVAQLNKYYLFKNEYLLNNKSEAQEFEKLTDFFRQIIR